MRRRGEGEPPPPEKARARALRALSRREHSRRELERKLTASGHDPDQASAVVETLAERGWQSDARYAESLLRRRLAQGYGPLRIRGELLAAGVDRAAAQALIDAHSEAALEALRRLVARRYPQPAADAAERQRRYRSLLQRGFPAGLVAAALGGRLAEIEALWPDVDDSSEADGPEGL